jgi:signal transduction histidine kinase
MFVRRVVYRTNPETQTLEVSDSTDYETSKLPGPDEPSEEVSEESLHWKSDLCLKQKNGRISWLSDSGVYIYDAHDQIIGCMGILTDITARKQKEESELQSLSRLQQAQKLESLGVLAGGIAHDFNNLLVGVMGNASLALPYLDETSEAYSRLLQIESTAQRMADLVRQMLAYSGQGQYEPVRLDFNKLIAEMSDLIRVTISKKAHLKIDCCSKPLYTKADTTQLRQVIINIVINASESLSDSPGDIRIETRRCKRDEIISGQSRGNEISSDADQFLEFTVHDTGHGIKKELLDKIFEPFYTTKFSGRGLGLAAVQGIVQAHHGDLTVSSEVKKGTTFRVFLPMLEKAHGSGEKRNADTLPDVQPSCGTIMVVDDEETIREVAEFMLNRLGYSALLARDGEEAVAKYKSASDTIQAVILDLTMPHMDGIETLHHLRQINPEVKVILTSGFAGREAEERLDVYDLDGFLPKPFRSADLEQQLAEVLGNN